MNEHLELQIKLLEKERIELREENNFIKNLLEIERQQVKRLAEQLNLCGVSNSLLRIDLKRWEHTCGDGCCYTDGMDIFLNNEELDEQNAEDSVNALTAVLTKLGYKFEINCY